MQPGHPGRAGHAAQPEQRHADHVRAQADQRRDPGLERGNGDAGDRRRDDQVHVGGGQAGLLQRGRDRLGAERYRVLEEHVVGAAEVVQPGVRRQRQRQVPGRHPGVAVQPSQHAAVQAGGVDDQFTEALGQLLLGVLVRWQDAAGGKDPRHPATLRAGPALLR